jgi:hypothetical protein
MTMYLPNPDVRPTGYEAGEFLEVPTIAPAVELSQEAPEAGGEDDETSTA